MKTKPIPIIPLSLIATFLSSDHIIEPKLLKQSPRLLGDAVGSPHFVSGDIAYAQGKYNANKLYGIYRLNNDLYDPDTQEFLGKILTFVASAEVSKNEYVAVTNKMTPFDLLRSKREAKQGDLILAIPEYEALPAYFLPQSVSSKVTGYILSSLNNRGVVGKWDAVVINKGKCDGI